MATTPSSTKPREGRHGQSGLARQSSRQHGGAAQRSRAVAQLAARRGRRKIRRIPACRTAASRPGAIRISPRRCTRRSKLDAEADAPPANSPAPASPLSKTACWTIPAPPIAPWARRACARCSAEKDSAIAADYRQDQSAARPSDHQSQHRLDGGRPRPACAQGRHAGDPACTCASTGAASRPKPPTAGICASSSCSKKARRRPFSNPMTARRVLPPSSPN